MLKFLEATIEFISFGAFIVAGMILWSVTA